MAYRILKSILIGTVGALALGGVAIAQTVSVNIPAGDLKTALNVYIKQTGVQLIYTVDDVDGIQSRAVQGSSTPMLALEQMLQGTGVVARRDASGAVMVSKRSTVDPVTDAGGSGKVETVVVTGSRVITNGNTSPTPLTMVSTDDLAKITPSNVPDALNKLPEFARSSSQRSVGAADSNRTGNFLNLRGFGSQRNLILFDGNRVPATAPNGTVDIDTLPQMLMSRVDVVTGGASAVYGSDAVTGVVNFILDKKFNGFKVNAQAGISARGDDMSWKAGIAWGKDMFGGRGHFEVSYEHYNSDGIPSMMDRPLGKFVLTESGSGTVANPNRLIINSRNPQYTAGGYIADGPLKDMFFVSNGVLVPFSHGLATGTAGNEQGGDGGYGCQNSPTGSSACNWLLYRLRTDHVFSRLDYDLTENVHAYVQMSGAQANNYGIYYPSWFSAKVPSTNVFLPASAQATLAASGTTAFTLNRMIQDQPGFTNSYITQNVGLTIGLSGTVLDKFDWNLHYTYGESSQHQKNPNNINNERLAAALDAVINSSGQVVCRVSTNSTTAALYPGCLPFNTFGPTAESTGASQYVHGLTEFKVINTLDDIAGSISGTVFDGWAGPIRAALSGEYREFSLVTNSAFVPTAKVNCTNLNPASCNPNASLWTSDLGGAMSASQNVYEGAIEVDVPVLKDIPLVELLEINAAGRYTQYSISGASTTWKLGAVWNVGSGLSFRGTVSRDIRAPTLFDLYAPTLSALTGYTDLLTGVTTGNINILSKGNPSLLSEVARTNTAGVVYTPDWLPRFSISFDMFQISINNAITSVSAGNQSVQQQCINSGGASPFCSLFIRPFPITNTTPANFPTSILSQSLNVAKTSTHGFDAELNYNFDMADLDSDNFEGILTSRLLLTYQPSLLAQSIPGAVVTNSAGALGQAAGRATLDIGWTNGPLQINVQERFLTGKRQSSNPALIFVSPAPIPHSVYTDITIAHSLKLRERDTDDAAQVFLSIQNLLDRQPHVSSGGAASAQGFFYPVSADEDFVGRYFTAGIRYRF